MYDAIVVGTRVAGAPTAMLLARRGLKVLAVDRAAFPSDTLSTHQVQVPGVARLARWGLLERLGRPARRRRARVRFDPGPVVLEGRWPRSREWTRSISPRRTLLDALLVDAAREAGAEVRERLRGRGAPVRRRPGRPGRPRRRLGARARAAGGRRRRPALARRQGGRRGRLPRVPARSIAYYTYWSGVPLDGGEMYARERRMIGAWPTNDGLMMTYVAAPADEFGAFRADPEGSLLRVARPAPATWANACAPASAPSASTAPPTCRALPRTVGPGWALVGDAGLRDGPDHRPGHRRRVPRRRAGWRRRSPASAASPTTARAATRRRSRCMR